MRYESPDLNECLDNPTAAQLEAVLRESPYEYWQRGGSGEAALSEGRAMLSISQPERGWFFLGLLPDFRVPYNGGTCKAFVKSEFGGNPFWIPRACLVGVDDAVAIATYFSMHHAPWPGLEWRVWDDLPLPADYPHEH